MTAATLVNGVETLRHADLPQLVEVLKSQEARAFDVVTPASKIKVDGNRICLTGIKEPLLFEDGVTDVNGLYLPTTVADEGISSKLGIDLRYLRRCRKDAPDLYEANVQGWLDRDAEVQNDLKAGSGERSFLLRLLRGDSSHVGVLRAFLSDKYRVIDNLDCLLAVLAGVKNAGIENTVMDFDLTERRMMVKIVVPSMAVYAEKFLEDYRNPFTGEHAGRGWTPSQLREAAAREGHSVDDKIVFAGLVVSNSEVGEGAFSITPRIVIGPCTNGLQLAAEAKRKTHMGAKLDDGIQWSEATLEANLNLITSQTTDAVTTFLNPEYVSGQIDKLTEKATEQIRNPQPVITTVSKKLGFSDTMAAEILNFYIRGGQTTVGGVMQAVTAAAQVVGDGDTAMDMESAAVNAMTIAHEENRRLIRA